MATVRIKGVTWQDGQLTGDRSEIRVILDFLESWDGELLPVYGNGPWREAGTEPWDVFVATAQAALGTDRWETDGIELPPFAVNPSDQGDVIA